MDISNAMAQVDAPTSSCGGCACDGAPAASPAAPGEGTTRFRIATMDCAAEESEIRRALDPIAGIRHVRFDLGQRQLDLSGTPQAIEQAATAMRRVGFDPQPLAMAAVPGAVTPGAVADSADPAPFGAGLWRLVAALGLAVGAEALAFFAPDLLPWRIATMALALAAIALAGLSTYKKGFAALRAGRLNINALMTVAVTGAFVIGQWPEAAMVMALYAIAELIEARAVDRARNAIRSLLALAPEDAEVREADGSWSHGDGGRRGRCHRAYPPRRTRAAGRQRDRRPQRHRSGPGHRREHPGRQGPRRRGLRHHQPGRGTGNARHRAGQRQHAGAHSSTRSSRRKARGRRRSVSSTASLPVYTPVVFALAVAVVRGAATAGRPALDCMRFTGRWCCWSSPARALVISTPVTVVSGLAAAARRGILIKGGVFLEAGA